MARPQAFLLRAALAAAAAVALALLSGRASAADEEESLEYAVKATYLYKFIPFVAWPADALAASPRIVICVVGEDPFGMLLDRAVRDQRIADRPLVVRRLETVEPGSGCHIAYLAGSGAQSVAEALDALRRTPVLTITDSAQETERKGVIHFVVEDNRVRFEIDAQAASENGLQISSKLLDLAVNTGRRS